jgi:filamentous hemagglutinin
VISAVQTAQQMQQAASQTSDPRMKALAAASTALSTKNAYDAVKAGQGTNINGQDGQIQTGTDAEGKPTSRDATTAEKMGGINISLSFGSNQSESRSTQTSRTAVGSTVSAGGNVSIVASGAGKDSNLTVQGSEISAGNNLLLAADNQVQLLAAQSTSELHGSNSSSSASVGVSFGTSGLLFNVGGSQGKGKSEGSDLTWTNTHVQAGNTLVLQSGGDTTLKGAVASGKQVIADVGGKLAIESLQDVSTYDSQQQNLGGSLSIGFGAMGASVSASQNKANSNYQSVTEQSAFTEKGDATH